MFYQPVYRIIGFERRSDIVLGSCNFSIQLDIDFAKKTRKIRVDREFHQRFQEIIQEIVGYQHARTNFLNRIVFLKNFSIQGDCACMGISGNKIDSEWIHIPCITYHGHNIDSKQQAYDLLTIFTYWVEVIQSLFFSKDPSDENKKA